MNPYVQMAIRQFKETFNKEALADLGIGVLIDTSLFTDITGQIPGKLRKTSISLSPYT